MDWVIDFLVRLHRVGSINGLLGNGDLSFLNVSGFRWLGLGYCVVDEMDLGKTRRVEPLGD